MFRHILMPTDGSELSERAVDNGVRLAKTLGARLSIVHVLPSFHALSYEAEAIELKRNEHLRLHEEGGGHSRQGMRACSIRGRRMPFRVQGA